MLMRIAYPADVFFAILMPSYINDVQLTVNTSAFLHFNIELH